MMTINMAQTRVIDLGKRLSNHRASRRGAHQKSRLEEAGTPREDA
jgi:hypothetical protein